MNSTSIIKRIIPQRDFYSTLALMILLLVSGSIIVWQAFQVRKHVQENLAKCANYKMINTLLTVVLAFGCVMIVLPLIVLALNLLGFRITNFKTLNAFENVLHVQTVVACIAIVNLALVFVTSHQLNKCPPTNKQLLLPLWITSIIVTVGAVLLLGIRFYEDYRDTEYYRKKLALQPKTGILDMLKSGLSKFGDASAQFFRRDL